MTNTQRAFDNINELVKFCKYNEANATFGSNGRIIHLMKDKIGNATYIYGEYGYDNEFFVKLDVKMEVVAIYAGGIVYVIDTFMFNEWEISKSGESLPEGVRWFRDYHKELSDKFENEFFPRYFENLVPTMAGEIEESRLYELARIELLGSGDPRKGQIERDSKLRDYDVAKILAGFGGEHSVFMDCVGRNANTYDSRKSREVAVKKYIAEHDVVEDYELRIAEALRNTDAKNVTVWFEKNGKQASAKISPFSIQRVLINKNDYFSAYNFANGTEAKMMFLEIGATDRGYGENRNNLRANDIVKIMYRGKAIYQREEA